MAIHRAVHREEARKSEALDRPGGTSGHECASLSLSCNRGRKPASIYLSEEIFRLCYELVMPTPIGTPSGGLGNGFVRGRLFTPAGGRLESEGPTLWICSRRLDGS